MVYLDGRDEAETVVLRGLLRLDVRDWRVDEMM